MFEPDEGVRIMGDTAKTAKADKAPKKSWFEGLKSEFKKIIWPSKQDICKETVAVVIVSVMLGVIIAIIDFLVQFGIDFLVK